MYFTLICRLCKGFNMPYSQMQTFNYSVKSGRQKVSRNGEFRSYKKPFPFAVTGNGKHCNCKKTFSFAVTGNGKHCNCKKAFSFAVTGNGKHCNCKKTFLKKGISDRIFFKDLPFYPYFYNKSGVQSHKQPGLVLISDYIWDGNNLIG